MAAGVTTVAAAVMMGTVMAAGARGGAANVTDAAVAAHGVPRTSGTGAAGALRVRPAVMMRPKRHGAWDTPARVAA